MGKFIRDHINYIKTLCRKAWEASSHFGGAFLNYIFVDYRDGSIWYDTEYERVRLTGWKIVRKFDAVRDRLGTLVKRAYWALVECRPVVNT